MYKNQLQELAQRSCFNLPSYACIREGPDHAPRFKASVNFNGEIFEGPSYCTTLRQAEHAAAEVALNSLSTKGPSRSIAARVLDETGVHKNLLQETAHRAGLNLPVYTTVRSGPGHLPVFTSTVELAEMKFNGAPAKTKKQAEKNAAMAAWAALKQMANFGSIFKTNKEGESSEEQEQVVVARVLSNLRPKDETKPGRQRDLNQARRRITLGYREKKFVSLPQSSLQFQQTRSINSDHSSAYPTHQNQQQSCFLSSLPHVLPPQAASKILPASSSKDQINHNKTIPVQVRSRSRSQVQEQEVPAPLEEHQKDEAEWLNGKSDLITETKSNNANSSSVFRPKPNYHIPLFTQMSDSSHQSKYTQIHSRLYGPVSPNVQAMAPAAVTIPRILNTGHHAHSIAPAVHIRSVIPVCAAPPMRLPSSNSPTTPPQIKEEQEVSEASSKFEDLRL